MPPSANCNPLHKSLLFADVALMKLVAHKYSLDFQDLTSVLHVLIDYSQRKCCISPLQAAVMIGKYQVCRRLLCEGADLFSHTSHVPHPLNIALKSKRYQIARLLINSGAKVDVSQDGYFPMYFAIWEDTPEFIVEEIIKAGFPPDCEIDDVYDLTPLHKAVACNNQPVVKLLMKYNVDGNKTDTQGCTPLHISVKKGLPEMVKLLAEYGVDLEVECKDEGFTPLFYAIAFDNIEVLKVLLQFGARIDHVCPKSLIYPLNFAVSLCRKTITEVLLKEGADVRLTAPLSGYQPLHSAVVSQQGKINEENEKNLENTIELLINSGSDVNAVNTFGFTPIQLAIKEENFKVAEQLVREGAEINDMLKQGTSSFHFVSTHAGKQFVKTFLDYGADYLVLDNSGISPYHVAILNPDASLVKLFWQYNCPFDLPVQKNAPELVCRPEVLRYINNQAIFISAMTFNDIEIMEKTLRNGAEAKGCSIEMLHPLHAATTKDFYLVVQCLLAYGVPANFINEAGETALHIAARNGYYEIFLCLLVHGASYNAITQTTGKTPLDLSKRNGHWKIVRILEEIDKLFQFHNEIEILKRIKVKFEFFQENVYHTLAFINCVDRKGDTLMAIALQKRYTQLASTIMQFRIENVD